MWNKSGQSQWQKGKDETGNKTNDQQQVEWQKIGILHIDVFQTMIISGSVLFIMYFYFYFVIFSVLVWVLLPVTVITLIGLIPA